MRNTPALIVSLIVSFTAGGIGGLAARQAPEFYVELSRPHWAPPAWVFGPVWTALYMLMAVAAWLVWKQKGARMRAPLTLFTVQLALNALWSWLFFAWRRGSLAGIEIVLLFVLILLTMLSFWRVRSLAGVLLVPYLAWVAYAAALTFELIRRNPNVL